MYYIYICIIYIYIYMFFIYIYTHNLCCVIGRQLMHVSCIPSCRRCLGVVPGHLWIRSSVFSLAGGVLQAPKVYPKIKYLQETKGIRNFDLSRIQNGP